MTLILSCLAPKYIVQVSDRRLTFPDGKVVDDSANKAIVFNGMASIAYTGIAKIGNLSTDEWITEQLNGQSNLECAINNLKSALDSKVKTLPYINNGLIIAIDLWGSKTNGKLNTPCQINLTNIVDPNTGKIINKPFDSFSRFTCSLPPDKEYAIRPLGQKYGTSDFKILARNIERVIKRNSDNPKTIHHDIVSRFMEEAVLEISKKNKYVGSNLMTTVIFNKQLPENQDQTNIFRYSNQNKKDPIIYAPILISPSMTIKGVKVTGLTNFTIGG